MTPPLVVHALNSVYGRRNLYGARSAHIAGATPSGVTLLAYCRRIEPRAVGRDNVILKKISYSFWDRARRSWASRTGSGQEKRRASWRGFDAAASRRLARVKKQTIKIFHSWEWMPKTYRMVRNRHPEAIVVKDVTIARRFEYLSGDDILDEHKLVDRFLSPSDFVTTCLRSWGIPETKIIQIPFGVDTDLFRPLRSRPEKPVRFAFSGKVSARKGIPRLLTVWKRLDFRDAELHLYGTLAPDVREMLDGVRGVRTYGFVDLTKELAKNHVFVFPSTFEGSSKSVFEALACGLPVVTTHNSGTVVRHGIDGYVLAPEDDAALAKALETLFADPRLRAKMGANARKRAEAFTWDAYVDRVWGAYRSLSDSIRATGSQLNYYQNPA